MVLEMLAPIRCPYLAVVRNVGRTKPHGVGRKSHAFMETPLPLGNRGYCGVISVGKAHAAKRAGRSGKSGDWEIASLQVLMPEWPAVLNGQLERVRGEGLPALKPPVADPVGELAIDTVVGGRQGPEARADEDDCGRIHTPHRERCRACSCPPRPAAWRVLGTWRADQKTHRVRLAHRSPRGVR